MLREDDHLKEFREIGEEVIDSRSLDDLPSGFPLRRKESAKEKETRKERKERKKGLTVQVEYTRFSSISISNVYGLWYGAGRGSGRRASALGSV